MVNEIADADRVELRACLVGRPGEQAVIGGMTRAAELEICLAVREFVAIEQNLFGAAGAALPADDRMLPAFAVADVVAIRPVGIGDGGVVFLDPALHLGEQRVLQGRRGAKRVRGVVVLGLEIVADRRLQLVRVAHHFLPVRGTQPGEFVDKRDAVPDRCGRPAGRAGYRHIDAVEHGRGAC